MDSTTDWTPSDMVHAAAVIFRCKDGIVRTQELVRSCGETCTYEKKERKTRTVLPCVYGLGGGLMKGSEGLPQFSPRGASLPACQPARASKLQGLRSSIFRNHPRQTKPPRVYSSDVGPCLGAWPLLAIWSRAGVFAWASSARPRGSVYLHSR